MLFFLMVVRTVKFPVQIVQVKPYLDGFLPHVHVSFLVFIGGKWPPIRTFIFTRFLL